MKPTISVCYFYNASLADCLERSSCESTKEDKAQLGPDLLLEENNHFKPLVLNIFYCCNKMAYIRTMWSIHKQHVFQSRYSPESLNSGLEIAKDTLSRNKIMFSLSTNRQL